MKKFILLLALSLNLAFAKVVILDPAIVEIFYLLGAEDEIAGIAKTSQSEIYPAEKTDKLPSVGTYIKPNLEQIIEMQPDIVITSFHSKGVVADLERFGIKNEYVKADSIDDIYKNIRKVAEITGKQEKAEEIIAEFQKEISVIDSEKFKGKKMVFFYAGNPAMAFNSSTLPGDIFRIFGLENIADKLEGSTPIVNVEFILEEDPDFIVILSTTVENFLAENPVLKNVKAVKNGKIYNIPQSSILRGTPRILPEIKSLYEKFAL